MRKTLLLLLAICIVQVGFGQKWKNKLKGAGKKIKAKTESVVGIDNTDYDKVYEGKEFPDMMNYLENWEGKKLKYFITSSEGTTAKGKVDVKYVKEGGVIKEIIIGSWNYWPKKSADSDKIKSFGGTPGSLYMNEENIVVYQTGGDGNILPRYVYGPRQSYQKLQAEIKYYNAYTQGLINADASVAEAERERIRKEKAAARLAEFGLADKEVASIEVVSKPPSELGHFVSINYDIVATLKNGKKISTAGGKGFVSDYEITKKGFNKSDQIGGGIVAGDQATITAKLKYKKSITHTKKINIPYNVTAGFELYGKGKSRSRGADGYDVQIEIKQEKNAVTGKPVLRVKLTSNASYAKERIFSISPDKDIIVYAYGGGGGVRDGNGKDGGDGGDITIIQDPSVKYFSIKYKNKGGAPGNRYASRGRDGEYRVQKRPVNF